MLSKWSSETSLLAFLRYRKIPHRSSHIPFILHQLLRPPDLVSWAVPVFIKATQESESTVLKERFVNTMIAEQNRGIKYDPVSS
jgi:hypothetical protein